MLKQVPFKYYKISEKTSEEELENISKEILETYTNNRQAVSEIHKARKELRPQIVELLKQCGVDFSKKVSTKISIQNRFDELFHSIHQLTIYNDNIKYENSDKTTISIGNKYENLLEEVRKIKSTELLKKTSENKSKEDFKVYMEYAIKNNIVPDSPEKLIIYVNEHARESFREENFPDGTEVYLKHGCDECSDWTVGEHRCSCGNRRISLTIEGNLINGFYGYPEPY